VAVVAKALNLSDYIPRSYIEQVQLSKLTNDFQTLTDDMRKRFSVDGRSVLDEIYGSSPTFGNFLSPQKGLYPGHPGSRSSGGAARGLGGRYSSRQVASSSAAAAAAAAGGAGGYPPPFPADFGGSPGRDSLLSTSAPARGSSPILINKHPAKSGSGSGVAGSSSGAAAAGSSSSLGPTRGSPIHQSPTSSVAAAAGSMLGPSSMLSSEGNGSIPGSLDSGSGAAAMAALAAAGGSSAQQQRGQVAGTPPSAAASSGGGGGSSSGGGFYSKPNGLLGQQLRNSSSRAGSNSSLHGMEGSGAGAGPSAGAAAAAGEQHTRLSGPGLESGGLTGDPTSLALLRRLQDEMLVVAEGFKRHSGMQLHLDALTHQYKHLNESMAALSAATKGLTEVVQQLQQGPSGVGAQTLRARQGSNPGPSGSRAWLSSRLQGEDAAGSAVLLGCGAVLGGLAAAAAVLLARRQ
jgi:hypothetical protein